MSKLRAGLLQSTAFLAICLSGLQAQSALVPPALPPPTEVQDRGTDQVTKSRTFSLGLKWNESRRQFLLPVENSTASPVDIIGVQTSGDIFVCNVPKNIPAKGSVKLHLYLVAGNGSANTQERVRVLTSAGEQVIQVLHDRPQSVALEPTDLAWTVGGAAIEKSVAVTIKVPGVKVQGVRAGGEGNSATLEELGSGVYKVKITPGTLSKANSFPVFLDVYPRLAGVAAVIRCEVGEAH